MTAVMPSTGVLQSCMNHLNSHASHHQSYHLSFLAVKPAAGNDINLYADEVQALLTPFLDINTHTWDVFFGAFLLQGQQHCDHEIQHYDCNKIQGPIVVTSGSVSSGTDQPLPSERLLALALAI